MIGQVPVFEAPDPTVVGTVKMFLTDPGAGVVPIRLRPAAEVGAVPIELVGSLDVGVVPATYSFSSVASVEEDMFRATRILSNDEILALPTTPIEILPAPGEGKLNFPLFAYWSFSHAANVTNIDPSASLTLSTDPTIHLMMEIQEGGGLISDLLAFNQSRQMMHPVNPIAQTIANVTNEPLKLFADNNLAGDFTGGDPNNSLAITVLYVTLDA